MIDPLLTSLFTEVAAKGFRDLLGGSRDESTNPIQRALLLEDIILGVLELEAEDEGRAGPAPLPHRDALPFDALYPEGLLGIDGPLAIEIKAGRRLPRQAVAALIDRYIRVSAAENLRAVLLVVVAQLSPRAQHQIEGMLAEAPIPITLLTGEPLKKLLDRHGDQLPQLLSEAALAPIRSALAEDSEWGTRAAALLAELRSAYRQQGVVLVLGAGTSIGSGLPNWDDLVASLFVSMITKQLGGKIDKDQGLVVAEAARGVGGESPLLSARYLRRGIEEGNAGDPRAFHRALSEALYNGLREEVAASPLLREIAKLCAPQRTGPKVHAVITYNFDDLLETQLSQESVQHCSVFSGREHPDAEELPVFHAHGFVPRNIDEFANLGEGVLAFSEEGYHQLFRDPYHWTNVAQLQAFQQQTCVFIGLSMTDPNLRRLLEYAVQRDDEPRHYVFLRRNTVADLLNASPRDGDDKPLLDEAAATDYLRVHHKLQELVLQELGLRVIWFDQFDAMPRALSELRT